MNSKNSLHQLAASGAHQPEVKAAAAARLGNAPESTVGSFAAIREWKNVFR